MRGALLGPQQLKVSLGDAVSAIGREGPIALVTCGWQEREDQDEDLPGQLGRKTINLKLYERGEQVLAADKNFARAHRARQDQLRQIQEFYRLRLERTFDAALAISRMAAGTDLEADELRLSMEQIRRIDQEHLERVAALREAHELQVRPLERPVIARHRKELKEILDSVGILAVAGGHVAVLMNRLRMFGIKELLGDHALVAWSGGAMATSERVVLFHESPKVSVSPRCSRRASRSTLDGNHASPRPRRVALASGLRMPEQERRVQSRRDRARLCFARDLRVTGVPLQLRGSMERRTTLTSLAEQAGASVSFMVGAENA